MKPPPPVEPICVKVNDAARMIGVGRTKLYELIASGEIEAIKLGHVRQRGVISAVALGHRQAAFAVMCSG